MAHWPVGQWHGLVRPARAGRTGPVDQTRTSPRSPFSLLSGDRNRRRLRRSIPADSGVLRRRHRTQSMHRTELHPSVRDFSPGLSLRGRALFGPKLGFPPSAFCWFRRCSGGSVARGRLPGVALRRPCGHCPTTPSWLHTGAGKHHPSLHSLSLYLGPRPCCVIFLSVGSD